MSLGVFEQKGNLEDTFPQQERTGFMEGKKAEGIEKVKREDTCLMVFLEEKHFSWCVFILRFPSFFTHVE